MFAKSTSRVRSTGSCSIANSRILLSGWPERPASTTATASCPCSPRIAACVAKGPRREEVSRGKDDFVARKPGSVLKSCGDVVLRQLGISCQDFFRRLPRSQFLKNQIDRDASTLKARLAHHHIGSDFDVLGQIHSPTLAANWNLLKESIFRSPAADIPTAYLRDRGYSPGRRRSNVSKSITGCSSIR